ncbi:unnamed protein product [Prorocentrum cordatum]|uniref:Uncharacterized protein n=1 Tax=Prorocentrum cordatum TaxID=2364126 RepID=A0ABN9Q8Y0_9DINO|nr:unnamed protein product [Polarella glacialis]
MANLASVCIAFLSLWGAAGVQALGVHEALASSRKPRKNGTTDARLGANLTLLMDSCQYIEVPAGSAGYVHLPYASGIRSLSMWFAPYKDLGYSWEYIVDARTGLGSGWFSFLNSMTSIHKGTNWRDTIYVNGVATTTSGLISAITSASYTSAPWVHLYIAADTTFGDDILLFSRYTGNEGMPGKIYSVQLWPSELSAADISNTMHGMAASVTPVASYSAADMTAFKHGHATLVSASLEPYCPPSYAAAPTTAPTAFPTAFPTPFPSAFPTPFPTAFPTGFPTPFPTAFPTPFPTGFPSAFPTPFPTAFPTGFPTPFPTAFPTASPTPFPTDTPTAHHDPCAEYAGEYEVWYQGARRDTNMIIVCDCSATQPGISDLLGLAPLRRRAGGQPASLPVHGVGVYFDPVTLIPWAMYILESHGEGKYECLGSSGSTISGNHYTAPNQYWGSVEYRLMTSAVCATSAPTPAVVVPTSGAMGTVAATGDPHLQNIHGERFDLMMPGRHTLIHIPRKASLENALLHVEAEAQRLGGQCADMYFQELNITGSWAEARQAGGFRFRAAPGAGGERSRWLRLGDVQLKVAHGHTRQGARYLNFYVRNLGHTRHAVGGLLGEDDHSKEEAPMDGCAHRMAL